MKAYLLTAVGVIFLTVIISFVVPEGKLKKSVNFVLRLVSIFVMIQPAAKIFTLKPEMSESFTDYSYVSSVYAQNQSQLVTQKIKEDFGLDCTCAVEIVFDGTQIKENGITVEGNFGSVQTIEAITEYLEGLGYIHITVNEKTD